MKQQFARSYIITFATALLGSPSVLLAQDSFEHKMVMKMTSSYTDYALKQRDKWGKFIVPTNLVEENEWTVTSIKNGKIVSDTTYYEYGTKIVKEKISNKEILEFLIKEGEIQGPLSGWSIVLRTNNDTYDLDVFAKKGDVLYPINIAFSGGAEATKESYSSTRVEKYNSDEEVVSDVTTEKLSFGALVAISAEWNMIEGQTMKVSGLLSESWTGKYIGKGEDRRFVETPGALKFTSLVGEASGEDEEGEWTDVIEGAWSASAGILLPPVL
jgi:hypothetical protein